MKLYRIFAIFLRHCILIPRDLHRYIDLVYWPLLDIILWGFMGFWVQKGQGSGVGIPMLLLTGLVLWNVAYRAHIEVAYSLLDELWSHNMVNLFSSPVTFSEWIIALLMLGIVKVCFILAYSIALVYLFYSLNIVALGWPLAIFIVSLVFSGWTIGLLTTGLITYFGQKIQTLAWVMGYLFAPFSAVYYPVANLPFWAQKISYALPMTYIFEAMRELISTGVLNTRFILIANLLNAVYFSASIFIFAWFFSKSKQYGLARLERFE